MKLCDYCNKLEGKYEMSTGKMCCESHYTKCPAIKSKISKTTKEAMKDPVIIKKLSDAATGRIGYWLGKHRSEETKQKISIYNKKRFEDPKEHEKTSKAVKKALTPQIRKKMSEKAKNYWASEKRRKKQSIMKKQLWKDPEFRENMTNENSPSWKGGGHQYCHYKAFELFGKDYCEVCGISAEEYKTKHNRRFSMHCRNGIHIELNEENWLTVCEFGCHQKMDKIDGTKNFVGGGRSK